MVAEHAQQIGPGSWWFGVLASHGGNAAGTGWITAGGRSKRNDAAHVVAMRCKGLQAAADDHRMHVAAVSTRQSSLLVTLQRRESCMRRTHKVMVGMQEAIDPAEVQAQGGVAVARQVQLPPGPYCTFAVGTGQLPLLWQLFTLEPAPVQTAALRKPIVGVGSHRRVPACPVGPCSPMHIPCGCIPVALSACASVRGGSRFATVHRMHEAR